MPRERLELDLSRALAALGQLDAALQRSAANFGTALVRAVSPPQSVKITGDTTELIRDIDRGVESADTQTEITGDAAGLTRTVEGAIDAADSKIDLEVDASDLAGAQIGAEALGEALGNAGEAGKAAGFATSAGAEAAGSAVATATKEFEKFGFSLKEIKNISGGLGIILGLGQLTQFLGQSVMAASSLNEAVNQTKVVFEGAADAVFAFGKDASSSVGLAEDEALKAAGTFGTLFKGAGLAADAAASMTLEMTSLAADLASFRDIPVEDALLRIQSGLVGEIEPLRRVGVLINANAVEQKALALGLAKTTDEITEQDKIQARYALILEQTKDAQGDFARTSEDLANSLRGVRAEIRQAQIAIGNELNPEITRAVNAFRDAMLPSLEDLSVALARLASGAIPVLANSAGSLTTVLEVFAKVISVLPSGLTEFGTSALLLTRILGKDAPGGVKAAAIGFAALLPILRAVDEEAADGAAQILTLAAAGFAVRGPMGAAVGAMIGAVNALGLFKSAAQEAKEAVEELGDASDREVRKKAVDAAEQLKFTQRALGESAVVAESQQRELVEQIRLMAENSDLGVGAAKRYGEALATAGAITEGQFAKALRTGIEAQQQRNDTTQQGTDLVEANKKAIEELASTIIASVPTLGGIFTDFTSQVQSAFGEQAIPSIQGFVDRLDATEFQVRIWVANIQRLIELGLEGLAAVVASHDPEIGNQIATQIFTATPKTRAAMDKHIEVASQALEKGKEIASKLGLDIATVLAKPAEAGDSGRRTGRAFGEGMIAGITTSIPAIKKAAARAVRAAERAARNEALSDSPSRLFASLGRDLTAGLAQGMMAPSSGLDRSATAMIGNVVASFDERSLANAVAAGVGNGHGGGVQVILVNSMAEARARVPIEARGHPWLNGNR